MVPGGEQDWVVIGIVGGAGIARPLGDRLLLLGWLSLGEQGVQLFDGDGQGFGELGS